MFTIEQGINNSATNPTAYVMQGKTDGDQNGSVMYMYVDKDVNITGKYTETDHDSTDITTYAMYLKAGWNSVIMTSEEIREDSYKTTIKTGTIPAGYNWAVFQD